jgi:tetratricopeptide (TPR) repeat protein
VLYEGQYAKAAEYLEATIPQLRAFSPQEVGLYNWLCGECLFKQEQWQRAIAYYEATTLMRHGNEKADALYRLGFCYINLHDMRVAKDYLESALIYYERAGSPDYKARVAQLYNMTAALRNYLGEE